MNVVLRVNAWIACAPQVVVPTARALLVAEGMAAGWRQVRYIRLDIVWYWQFPRAGNAQSTWLGTVGRYADGRNRRPKR